MWSHAPLEHEVCSSKEQAVDWCQRNGLLVESVHCSQHRTSFRFYINRGPFGVFRCPSHKSHSGRTASRSAACGTWWEDLHVPLVSAIRLAFAWARDLSYDEAQLEASVSRMTVAEAYSRLREVVVASFLEEQEKRGMIGGPGQVVQIDEAKFGDRKYHVGRIIDGHWLLGMIEDGSEDIRFVICPNNCQSASALTPIIKRHVAAGSEIHTDGWKAYRGLRNEGYVHYWVNHKENFVSPWGIHTQRIEASWRPLRVFFRDRRVPHEDFADCVVEYQWRRWCKKQHIDPFDSLLERIKKVCPV